VRTQTNRLDSISASGYKDRYAGKANGNETKPRGRRPAGVICPNCNASLLRRERTRRRCSRCRAEFALEPKENVFKLHDLRMRAVADRLSNVGALRYTETQLWYAAGRKALQSRVTGGSIGCGVVLLVVGGTAILVAVAARSPVLAVLAAVVLFAAVIAIWALPRRPVRMPMPLARFRTTILGRWGHRYGGPPVGLIDTPVVPEVSPRARAALLCADQSTAVCLWANGAPGRYGVWLAASVQALPPALPVLVLHDASVAGYLLVAEARRAAGGRVVDLGLRPRSVAKAPKAIRLREGRRTFPADDTLRHLTGLTDEEISWLEHGWWSPVAAIPPARLLSLVADGVDRVDAGGDPDRRAARAVGFMTWPEP
jgi:hypothetical protein